MAASYLSQLFKGKPQATMIYISREHFFYENKQELYTTWKQVDVFGESIKGGIIYLYLLVYPLSFCGNGCM